MPGRGLVEQEQLGIRRERAGDLHAALVAVGEVHRQLLGRARAQADVVEHLAAVLAGAGLLLAHPGGAEDRPEDAGLHAGVLADHDVLQRRHGREEPDVLERPGDAHGGDLVRPHGRSRHGP
jgi:hypothetical protein